MKHPARHYPPLAIRRLHPTWSMHSLSSCVALCLVAEVAHPHSQHGAFTRTSAQYGPTATGATGSFVCSS